MGKWAMYRRRGSSPPGETTAQPLPPVLLTFAAPTTLAWSVDPNFDPSDWIIFLDGVQFDDVPGILRVYNTDTSSGDWTVQGINAGSEPVTQLSNTATN